MDNTAISMKNSSSGKRLQLFLGGKKIVNEYSLSADLAGLYFCLIFSSHSLLFFFSFFFHIYTINK